ncbi:MAG: Holliday junction branch migration protein RuvA [Bowdeniella nasicola]|nr:Holliday junction branch migration protein RuvA [Bowdeniella nasicola]
MIDQVRGTVIRVRLDHVVIDVGGIGMRLEATPATLATLREGQETCLVTEFVVRQDSMSLYAFATTDERECFLALQSVTGVGVRTALAVLAVHTPDELRRAVASEDLAALQKVPGIGKKSASRMVLELKDKLGAPSEDAAPVGPSVPVDATVVDALIGLGWQAKVAERAVRDVSAPGLSTAEVLRGALQHLGGKA